MQAKGMKMLEAEVKFTAEGLVPAVIQDDASGEVLTLCYLNRDALEATVKTGKVHVWRRSRGRLMMKGETSGHVQEVVSISVDCEGNSLLLRVKPQGAGCHSGYHSCYFRRYDAARDRLETTAERVFDPSQVYESKDSR